LRKYCSRFSEEYFCNGKDFHRRKEQQGINDKIFIAEGMAESFRVEGTAVGLEKRESKK